jgi:hypothetical protein
MRRTGCDPEGRAVSLELGAVRQRLHRLREPMP